MSPNACVPIGRLAVLVATLWSPVSSAQKGPAGIVTPEHQAAERKQRWAVLIGVNQYEDEQGIGSLKYCVADMKLLYEVLTGPRGGFRRENVLLMTDSAEQSIHRPTYSNMVTMIPRWLEDVGPEDDVLIAFSGHGMAEDDQCYLLPGDAKRGALRLTSVSVPQVREWLEGCRAERKVLILDACHSGAGKAPGQMSEEMKEEMEQGRGFLRLASCDTKQKSSEDPKLGHGVFTYSLVEALRGRGDLDGDGRVGADEAYRYVSKEVRRWARERGLHQDPLMSGRLVGGQLTLCYAPPRAPQKPATVASPDLVDLMLRLDPPDTQVLIDGERMPVRERGRVAFMRMTPGRHVVEAMKDGYARVEKVIDVPTGGAEGTVRLAQMVTHVTVYMRSGRKREGELLSRSGDKITLKMGKGRITLGAGQYERLEEREVAEGESSVEVFAKGSESVDAAIGQGLISPLPEGTLEERVKVFRERWDVNEESLRKAEEVYGRNSPEARHLERQKQALFVQAGELTRRIKAKADKEDELRKSLLAQGQSEHSPVVRAASQQVWTKLGVLAPLAPCLSHSLIRELGVVPLVDDFDNGSISEHVWPRRSPVFSVHRRNLRCVGKSLGERWFYLNTPSFEPQNLRASVRFLYEAADGEFNIELVCRDETGQIHVESLYCPATRAYRFGPKRLTPEEWVPAGERAAFGDERTTWHQLEISYDFASRRAAGSVDGRPLGETQADFSGRRIYLSVCVHSWGVRSSLCVLFDDFESNVVVPLKRGSPR